MAQQTDQQQLAKVFGSLMAAKDSGEEEQGPDPQVEYYKQREKYEKRRMVSSILAPIAGQFLGNLIAAPFREPVQDFLDTQKGREVYGQWAKHSQIKNEVDAMTAQMEKHDGSGLDYMIDLNRQRYDEELKSRWGEKWTTVQDPLMQSAVTDYNAAIREIGQKEYNEYLKAVDYYKLFPDQETFLSNIERYGPRSSNLGQAVYRKIKRAISGQSEEEYVENAILKITGVNSDIFKQEMDKEFVDDHTWGMDVGSFREAVTEAISPVSDRTMLTYITEATEKYYNTSDYGLDRAARRKDQLLLESGQRAVTINRHFYFNQGDPALADKSFLWNDSLEETYTALIDEKGQDYRPTFSELSRMHIERKGLAKPSEDSVLIDVVKTFNWMQPFLNGTEPLEGEERFPGLYETVFTNLYSAPDDFGIQYDTSKPLEYNLGQVATKQGQTVKFVTDNFNARTDRLLKSILYTAKTMAAINMDNLDLPSEYLEGPLARPTQDSMVFGFMKEVMEDHLVRGDITIFKDNLFFDPTETTAQNLIQSIDMEKALGSVSNFVVDEIENMEQEILDTNEIVDISSVGGPPPESQVIETDENIVVDPTVTTTTTLPLSQITTEKQRKEQGYNRSYDYSNAVATEAAFLTEADDFGSTEELTALLEYFKSFPNEEQLNIPGTRAFNFMNIPLFNSLQQNPIPPIAIPGSDGLFMRISPQIRPHGTLLTEIEESVDGKFLQIEIGRFESLGEEPPEFVLGRGTLASAPDELTPTERGGRFIPLTDVEEARRVLREFSLPNEISNQLAVIAENSYVPLLRELDSLNVPINDMIPKTTFGGASYMDEKTGAYKGDTPREVKINQNNMGLDLMQRFIGVPGIDKAGPRPIMHDLLLQSYMKHVGPANDEEELFISSLFDVDMSFMKKARDTFKKTREGIEEALENTSLPVTGQSLL